MKEFFVKLWSAIKTNWKYILIGTIIAFVYGLTFGLMQMSFMSIIIFTNISMALTMFLGIFYAKLISTDFKASKIGWVILVPILLDLFIIFKLIF